MALIDDWSRRQGQTNTNRDLEQESAVWGPMIRIGVEVIAPLKRAGFLLVSIPNSLEA